MPKHARQKRRHRDIRRNPARQRDQIWAEADFGDFELAVKIGAFKAFFDRHRDVVNVAAFDLHAAIGQGPDPIIVPGRDRDR
jgi:hypothetical protein